MSRVARVRTSLSVVAATAIAVTLAACGSGASQSADSSSAAATNPVTLEFAQWWEPELPAGSLRGIMDKFEAENPGIKVELISGPYASTKEQVIAGAASGTMSDVVGLDGAWVNDFVKQGAITDLSALMKDAAFNDSQLSSQVKIDGSTYMIPVVNFVYPLFVNNDLLKTAGVAAIPSTRSEFASAAEAITAGGQASGWILPLSMEAPNGVQNDVMSWVWASGGSMLKDGQPDLTNADVTSGVDFVKQLWDNGVVAPGALTMKEQDKVEEFTNGRVGMMIDSLAHINQIREKSPDLNFSVAAIPAADDFTGKRGIPYASWGIGIAENSEHKAEAFKLLQYLMSTDVNSQLSSIAKAFPGNTQSVPDFVASDELFKKAFEIYQSGYPANEFVGLPAAEDLMRTLDQQLQTMLNGEQSVTQALEAAQQDWQKTFQD